MRMLQKVLHSSNILVTSSIFHFLVNLIWCFIQMVVLSYDDVIDEANWIKHQVKLNYKLIRKIGPERST